MAAAPYGAVSGFAMAIFWIFAARTAETQFPVPQIFVSADQRTTSPLA